MRYCTAAVDQCTNPRRDKRYAVEVDASSVVSFAADEKIRIHPMPTNRCHQRSPHSATRSPTRCFHPRVTGQSLRDMRTTLLLALAPSTTSVQPDSSFMQGSSPASSHSSRVRECGRSFLHQTRMLRVRPALRPRSGGEASRHFGQLRSRGFVVITIIVPNIRFSRPGHGSDLGSSCSACAASVSSL